MTLPPLRLVLLAVLFLPLLSVVSGESWRNSRSRHSRQPQLFRVGYNSLLACMIVPEDEAGSSEEDLRDGARLSSSRRRTTSASRRPVTTRPRAARPDPEDCPSGVTYFDGCNSCSCGTDQLCTLKLCNNDTMVRIFDPCTSHVQCGYHQRCQPICVGEVCQLRPLCVSDDSPRCYNCPWLCVDERLHCSDRYGSQDCKPSLACYKPNV